MLSPVQTDLTILVVEDDDGHAALIQEHLVEAGVPYLFQRFRDGQEALDFLDQPQPQPGPPYLMLLDLRMPRLNGVQVLQRLKAHPTWRRIPVIMLTTTDDPREIQMCYELGCSSYITKPIEYDRFAETLRRLGLFLPIVQVAHYDN